MSPSDLLRTPRQLFAAAAACAAGFIGVLVVAYGSEPAARIDARALDDFGKPLREPLLSRLAEEVTDLANPAPFAVLSIVVTAIAFFMRSRREAVAVAVLLLGANVSTQILKPILASPRGTLGGYILGPEAFPSGHATASMSLALAAVLVARRRSRPFAALAGATFAIAVGFSLVAIDAHFPSDVAGGYLMAGGWCFAALGALGLADRRFPRAEAPAGDQPASLIPVYLMLGALAVAAAVGASRLPELIDHVSGHTAFAVVAAGTAALATLLTAAVAVAASANAR